MVTIPVQRSLDTVTQADSRVVAELAARARDVERAALRIEVHTTAIDWRLDAERDDERLAQRAGDPERPDGQVKPGRPYAGDLSDQRDQLVQRRILTARENVGAAGGGRLLAAQAETLDEIVDMGQMVVDL